MYFKVLDLLFDEVVYCVNLNWLFSYDVVGLFVVGGMGEFFLFIVVEIDCVVCVVVVEIGGKILVIVLVGCGMVELIEYCKVVEVVGVDGILLLLLYLIEVFVDGVVVYVE